MPVDVSHIPETECRSREDLKIHQGERLRQLLHLIDGKKNFYVKKLATAGINPSDLVFPKDLETLPITTKAELIADQEISPPWGTVLTEPIDHYTRYNQTSSTTGHPLRWLDTSESWQWMLKCWKSVYTGAKVGARDRIFFPFSFGPFLGFWTAFEAGTQIGAHCVPAGGMTSEDRLQLIKIAAPTVICCTPTYALRLLEVSRNIHGGETSLADSSVRVLIVAGEPGGNITSTRTLIERGWGARVIDHHGMTEVGPVSFECWENPGGLHLNEREFICEVHDPETGRPLPVGEQGELVITNLGRTASPVIRYRTGDLVQVSHEPCICGRTLARLEGGILSRIDDMVCVSGVNVYPSSIESVMRDIREIVEYRATIKVQGALRTLAVEIEVDPAAPQPHAISQRAARALREALGLTTPVTAVSAGTLPRFEMKARRCLVVP